MQTYMRPQQDTGMPQPGASLLNGRGGIITCAARISRLLLPDSPLVDAIPPPQRKEWAIDEHNITAA